MSSPIQPPLTVETVDGTTSGRPITKIKVTNGDLTISGSTATIDTGGGGGGGGGTVTSVGSSQAFITITNPTTTPSISIGNASGSATGVLTASDFNTFDAKQDAITLTTTGTTGNATFAGGTLNIPNYTTPQASYLTLATNSGLTDERVLTAGTGIAFTDTGAGGTLTIEATGGSGSIGGSISEGQIAFGSSTANEIEGSSNFTFDSTNNVLTGATTFKIDTASAGGTIRILNGGSEVGRYNQYGIQAIDGTSANPSIAFVNSFQTGFYRPSANEISISLNATRLFDFQTSGSSGKLQFRGAAPIIECDDASADLSLRSGGSTYGEILVSNQNSDIEIKPAGTGKVKISDAYTLPSIVTAANDYVLTAQTDGTTAWAAASGGSITFPIEADSGSSGAPSYSFSADTDTGMYLAGASNIGIVAAGNSYLSIGSLGAVQFDRKALFNAASETAPNAFATDTNTGFYLESADVLAFVEGGTTRLAIGRDNDVQTDGRIRISSTFGSSTTAPAIATTNDKNTGISFAVGGNSDTLSLINGGTETLRFGASGEILIGGTAAGTTGQVLTSGGSGAAVSWTTVSGGGGLSGVLPQTGSTSENQYNLGTTVPWGMGGNDGSASMATMTQPFAFPFIAPETGTVSAVGLNIVSSASQNAYVAFYSQDSNNLPSTRLGYAEVNLGSTGDVYQTTITGTISLTAGTQYWYSINSDVSGSATLKAVQYIDGLPNMGICSNLSENGIAIKDNSATSNAVPPASFTASFTYGNWNRVQVGIKY